ncbi:MAG: hypothetical protein U0821_22165 [Chloroflexota bacterium]
MPLPDAFVEHLREFGYHPRSDRHSNALAEAIIHDFLQSCERVRQQAKLGELVYALNMDTKVRTSTWNVDLVLGVPPSAAPPSDGVIARATPSAVRVAIEIKTVMTEHRKAVKNRKRDFEAHHEHVHNYSRRAVAAGVLVVNASTEFRSPLRTAPTTHGSRQAVNRLVEHCITEMRNVAESGGSSSYGMDAKTVITLDFDNVHLDQARFTTALPAPQPGDPLHYDSFIRKLCDEYCDRFPS